MHNPWNPAVRMFSHPDPRVNKLNGYYGVRSAERSAAIWTQHEPIAPHSAGMDLVVKGFVMFTEIPPSALARSAGKRVWEVTDDLEVLKRFSAADIVASAEWDAEAEVYAFRVTSLAHR